MSVTWVKEKVKCIWSKLRSNTFDYLLIFNLRPNSILFFTQHHLSFVKCWYFIIAKCIIKWESWITPKAQGLSLVFILHSHYFSCIQAMTLINLPAPRNKHRLVVFIFFSYFTLLWIFMCCLTSFKITWVISFLSHDNKFMMLIYLYIL